MHALENNGPPVGEFAASPGDLISGPRDEDSNGKKADGTRAKNREERREAAAE